MKKMWSIEMKMNMILAVFFGVSLSACVAPVVDHQGKTVPVLIQTPTVIIDARETTQMDLNTPMYVCKLKPFIDTYQSEHIHRGQAKLAVQKQCLAKHHEMFCQEKDIQCTEYK